MFVDRGHSVNLENVVTFVSGDHFILDESCISRSGYTEYPKNGPRAPLVLLLLPGWWKPSRLYRGGEHQADHLQV
jgi:hypothetical protein